MKRIMFAGLLAIALSAGLVVAALAHAKLDHCTPAVGSTVAQAPTQIVCVMSEEIDTKLSTMSVSDVSGSPVDKKDAHVDLNDPDHKTLIVSLDPALVKNGIYTVKWHSVTPDDGGITDGTFQFVVGSAPVTPFPATQVGQESGTAAATTQGTIAPTEAATSQPAATPTVAPASQPATATVAPTAASAAPAPTASSTPSAVRPATGGSPAYPVWILALLGLMLVLGGWAIRRLAQR